MAQRIQRKRTRGWRMPDSAVSVTRPGRFGNPFKIGTVYRRYSHNWFIQTNAQPGERLFGGIIIETMSQVMSAFIVWAEWRLTIEPNWLEPLRDKDAACFCPVGSPCHGDVLLELANRNR